MRYTWMSVSCFVVMFALMSAVAAQDRGETRSTRTRGTTIEFSTSRSIPGAQPAGTCPPAPTCTPLGQPDLCHHREACLFGICVPCGCHGQGVCLDGDPCDDFHRQGVLGLFCYYSGYSEEPTTNSTVIVPSQDPDNLWGWVDLHEHQFANLAYGGAMFPGSPFDARGVNAALAWDDYTFDFSVSLPSFGLGLPPVPAIPLAYSGWPIHGGDFVTQALYGLTNNIATDHIFYHVPGGTGPFDGWPTHTNGGHQQMYYKWLERAYEGGLRLLVNYAVDNEVLCEISFQRAGFEACNDMLSVDRQIAAMYQLEAFIDGQCGTPGCGWYRIATSAQQAREIISAGKMVVSIGLEVDTLFNCRPGDPACTEAHVRDRLNHYYDMGVRNIFPVHAFDNEFAGAGMYTDIFAYANFYATGHTFNTWDCSGAGYNFKVTPFDTFPLGLLYEGIKFATGQQPPFFDLFAGAHCNAKGLTPRGEFLLDLMIEKDMFIQIDHLSHRALEGYWNGPNYVKGALEIFEDSNGARGYTYPPISGHPVIVEDTVDRDANWRLDNVVSEYAHTVGRVKRIRDLGGVVAVNQSSREAGHDTTRDFITGVGIVKGYNDLVDIMDGDNADVPFYGEGHPAIGLLNDMGSFLHQPGPRSDGPELCYPFPAFDGSGEFCPQQTGDQVFDFNIHGLAHIGLMPDFLADIRTLSETSGEPNADLEPLFSSAETFVRMWERIDNCTPDGDGPSLTCPPDTTIECDESIDPSNTGTAVAGDFCDPTPVVNSTDSVADDSCPQTITRTWLASDASGNVSECTQTISLQDTTAPVITSLTADPAVLWPPNHKMISITITPDVIDSCDPEPTCEIVSVITNEINLPGDGNTESDWEVTGSLTLDLRAERSGRGNGRLYTVEVSCTDECGNPTTDTVSVSVPHSRRGK